MLAVLSTTSHSFVIPSTILAIMVLWNSLTTPWKPYYKKPFIPTLLFIGLPCSILLNLPSILLLYDPLVFPLTRLCSLLQSPHFILLYYLFPTILLTFLLLLMLSIIILTSSILLYMLFLSGNKPPLSLPYPHLLFFFVMVLLLSFITLVFPNSTLSLLVHTQSSGSTSTKSCSPMSLPVPKLLSTIPLSICCTFPIYFLLMAMATI